MTRSIMTNLDQFQVGDVLAFSGHNSLSRMIRAATLGSISHVGIVAYAPSFARDKAWRRPIIYESTTQAKRACYRVNYHVSGVQAHSITWRLADAGKDGVQVWHYPLTNPLTATESAELTDWCEERLGVPYDWWGAVNARCLGFGWLRHLLWSHEHLDSYQCSEFVADASRMLGRFATADASKWNPSSLCRAMVRQGSVQKPRRV